MVKYNWRAIVCNLKKFRIHILVKHICNKISIFPYIIIRKVRNDKLERRFSLLMYGLNNMRQMVILCQKLIKVLLIKLKQWQNLTIIGIVKWDSNPILSIVRSELFFWIYILSLLRLGMFSIHFFHLIHDGFIIWSFLIVFLIVLFKILFFLILLHYLFKLLR